jgi:hypothetical protein
MLHGLWVCVGFATVFIQDLELTWENCGRLRPRYGVELRMELRTQAYTRGTVH